MRIRKFIATSSAALMMVGVAAVPATAQVEQDGLVNVNVGDVTVLQDVSIGVAAQLAAQICGVRVGPVAVLGTTVDRSGEGDRLHE